AENLPETRSVFLEDFDVLWDGRLRHNPWVQCVGNILLTNTFRLVQCHVSALGEAAFDNCQYAFGFAILQSLCTQSLFGLDGSEKIGQLFRCYRELAGMLLSQSAQLGRRQHQLAL